MQPPPVKKKSAPPFQALAATKRRVAQGGAPFPPPLAFARVPIAPRLRGLRAQGRRRPGLRLRCFRQTWTSQLAPARDPAVIRGETAPSARGGCLSERVFSGGNTLSPSGCSPLTSDSGSDPSSPQRGLHLRGLESSSILVLTEGSEPQRANVAQGASSPLNPCPLERGKDGSGGSGGSGGSKLRVLKRTQGARELRGLERPQRAATLT